MFKNLNLFGVFIINKEKVIKRIVLEKKAQRKVNEHFSSIINNQKILEKEKIKFDGRYKPESNEVLYIPNFSVGDDIKSAIKSSLSEEKVNLKEIEIENLKYTFIGTEINDEMVIAFQLIQKSQHLTNKWIKLLHYSGTFKAVSENGFTLSDRVEAIIDNGNLIFGSYHFAKRIFDLKEYYREATDADLKEFMEDKSIKVEGENQFIENSDTWVRRKVALIKDSGVLEKNSVSEICNKGSEYNIDIPTVKKNGTKKILLANDKRELKNVLKFLDEDIFKGILSDQIFETNSKLIVD